jgi:ribose transport system permease protein
VGRRRRALRDSGGDPGRHQPLSGGYSTVLGSVLGALLVGLINNGLTLMGLEFSQQQIVRGAIIILAVALARKGLR